MSRKGLKPNLKHGDDGPQQAVKVLAVGDGVSVLRLDAELTAEQVHTQDAAGTSRTRSVFVLFSTSMLLNGFVSSAQT